MKKIASVVIYVMMVIAGVFGGLYGIAYLTADPPLVIVKSKDGCRLWQARMKPGAISKEQLDKCYSWSSHGGTTVIVLDTIVKQNVEAVIEK